MPSFAATGTFAPHCDGASFYLSKVDGLKDEHKLNINLRQSFTWENYRPVESWTEVYAERCFSAGKCEQATHAKIWLNKISAKDKHASGRYDVDFEGQHLQGEFLVKYRKENKRWICE